MNANEIADKLEQGHWEGGTREQAATMLRQQQAEYYSLLVNHDKLYAKVVEQQAEIDTYKLQNSRQIDTHRYEPVAWMMENPQNKSAYLTYEKPTREMKISHQAIPLYTHPAKTLTDEEIMVLYEEYIETQYASESNVLGFGRAILRKAQEG